MTTHLDVGLRARGLLFEGDPLRSLAAALRREGVTASACRALGRLSPAGREVAGDRLAQALDALLDVDLEQVLVHAWRTHGDLVAAARRSLQPPGAPEVVDLAAQRVVWTSEPSVELLLDDVPVCEVHVLLTVELLLEAVVATVADGRLRALALGDCRATASLSVEGRELASRSDVLLPLPGELELGQGWTLAHAAAETVPLSRRPTA